MRARTTLAPVLACVLGLTAAASADATDTPADDEDPIAGDSADVTGTAAPIEAAGPAVTVRASSPGKLRRLYLRAGVAHIAPLSSSREMELANLDGPATLALKEGPIAGSGSEISSATIPGVILGYRLNRRWALETILGLPFTVKFRATGTLANEPLAPMALGLSTGVKALGPELGEAKAAPPLVTAVYSLRPEARVRPYVGTGLAVMITTDAKVTNPTLIEVREPEMSIAPAPGWVLQTGLEATLYKRIYARLDVKFIALMLARAEVNHIVVRTPDLPLFESAEIGTAKMSVWVNPLIIQAGIGTDF